MKIIVVGAERGILPNSPTIQMAGVQYNFTVVTGEELTPDTNERTVNGLSAQAGKLGYTLIPCHTPEMQRVIEDELINNDMWKNYGLDDVVVILGDVAFRYVKGMQWTCLPDAFFMVNDSLVCPPRCNRIFEAKQKFLFLVAIKQGSKVAP